MDDRIIEIEKNISSLETSVKDIRYDIARVREDSNRGDETPSWIKTAGVFVLLTVFANIMASVWWASKITSTQDQIIEDVRENIDEIEIIKDLNHEVMLELNRLSVILEGMDLGN